MAGLVNPAFEKAIERAFTSCRAPVCNLPAQWELESAACKRMQVCGKHRKQLEQDFAAGKAPYFKVRELRKVDPLATVVEIRKG
jgi:hypothetical protein